MMHVIATRRELAETPGLVEAVSRAFSAAKDQVEQRYLANASKRHMAVTTPWFGDLFARNPALLGDDWWPRARSRPEGGRHVPAPPRRAGAVDDAADPGGTSSFPL